MMTEELYTEARPQCTMFTISEKGYDSPPERIHNHLTNAFVYLQIEWTTQLTVK